MYQNQEFEALHPRAKGKFTNKHQSAGTTVLTVPSAPSAGRTPIMARATLQEWDGDQAETVGEIEFDAATVLAGMTPEERAALGQDAGDQDIIFEKAMSLGLIPQHGGPFEVDVREALDAALEADPSYFEETDPAAVTAPADFDRSRPSLEGWPESLAEPEVTFETGDSGAITTVVKINGEPAIEIWNPADDIHSIEDTSYVYEGSENEEAHEQAVEWARAKHEIVADTLREETRTAVQRASHRVLAAVNGKPKPLEDGELLELIAANRAAEQAATRDFQLASCSLVSRGVLAEHPEADGFTMDIDSVDTDGDTVMGITVMDSAGNKLASYSTSEDDQPAWADYISALPPEYDSWMEYSFSKESPQTDDGMYIDVPAYFDVHAAAAWSPGA